MSKQEMESTDALSTSQELQDEIELPDIIEKLPKPDKGAHEAQVNELQKEIKSLQDRSNTIRLELEALKSGRGTLSAPIQEAKTLFTSLRKDKDALIQEKNEIMAKLRTTQDQKEANIKSQRNLKSTLKYTTEEEFNTAISELSHQQETRSMTLNEEKRIIKELEQLQQQRKQVSKIAAEQTQVDKSAETIKEIKAQVAKKNQEIDDIQAKLTEIREKLDALYAQNEKEKKEDQFPILVQERKDIKEQVDIKWNQIRTLREEFKVANNKYYDNIRLVRKKKMLQRQKEEEERKKEYEAKLAEYEKEMAKIHPYQEEMDLCTALTLFLEKNFAKELAKAEAEEKDQDTTEDTANTVELDGLKPMQRKEEVFMGGLGKKKKGPKPSKKTKRDAKLVLPMAQIDAFSTLGLMPPATISALSSSLKQIKEKKEWYQEQTTRAESDVPASSNAKATNAKGSSQKKSKKQFNAEDQSAFPSLGNGSTSGASPPGFSSTWGQQDASTIPDEVEVQVTEQIAAE